MLALLRRIGCVVPESADDAGGFGGIIAPPWWDDFQEPPTYLAPENRRSLPLPTPAPSLTQAWVRPVVRCLKIAGPVDVVQRVVWNSGAA